MISSGARAGAVPLLLTATFADGKRRVTTEPQRVPLLIAPLGGLAADINADHLVIENDFFRLTCRAKGGDCRVWNKALKTGSPTLRPTATDHRTSRTIRSLSEMFSGLAGS